MEHFYLEILDSLCDGIYFVDTERRITFWNHAAERITGYRKEEMLGKCCQSNLLNHIDQDGRPLCLLSCPLYQSIFDGQRREAQVFLRHKDGQRIPVHVVIIPVEKDGVITGAIEIFTPNSPIVYDDNLIEHLSNLAMCDQLTGTPNRRKLASALEFRLLEYQNFASSFCVIFLDLDNFGDFNNRYGHELGDRVLTTIAKAVTQNLRTSDLFGRWGGEEFLGIFELDSAEEGTRIAERLRMLIERSEIQDGEERLFVTASLGIAVARKEDTSDSMVERADQMMYKSKQKDKNCVTSDADL